MAEAPVTAPHHHAGAYHGANGHVNQQVIHDEEFPLEADSAVKIAGLFAGANAGGCAHYIHSSTTTCHTCAEDALAWHAPPNTGSIGHERDGYASWDRAKWNRPDAQQTTCRVAARVAEICVRRRIPVRWLEVAAVKANAAGITSHNNKSLAFHMSDHTDPGPHFPVAHFMSLVRTCYAWFSHPRHWQSANGLRVDGVIGEKSLDAAVALLMAGKHLPVPAPTKPDPKHPAHPGSTTKWRKVSEATVALRLWDCDPGRSGPVHTLQAALGADTVDGYYGRDTKALVVQYQRAHGLPVTGVADRATRRHVYGTGPTVPVSHGKSFPSLTVDGIAGHDTMLALQRTVGAMPTGVLDAATRRAVQRYLHVTVDGVWGRITVRALQAHVGVPSGRDRDGLLGAQTWRRVQKALRDGTF